jgi:DNA-binding winged helix-turn-helix (wHTH) protein/Tfp pilus assembly protein PilF
VWFDDFELDLKAGELRRAGARVPIPPQQFTVLAALVEDPGALVSRDQLRTRLWGDDSFVDFDAGLNFCIRQLRATLGDTATQPRFIQTVPRRGYRFIAPVHASERTAPSAEIPAVAAAVGRPAWVTASVAAVLTMAVAGTAWWSLTSAAASRMPTPPTALTADARIADAHAAHGFVALNDDWAWAEAERSFGRALQLDPAHEVALISMSRLHASQHRVDSAVRFAQRAVDAHPTSLRAVVTLGWSHLFAGDYRAALVACSRALEQQPQSGPARLCLLNAQHELGSNLRQTWQQMLDDLPQPERQGSHFLRASLAARLGRSDEALHQLRQALDAREHDAMFATIHPAFVGLRTHPDFIEALKRAGLREFSSSAH